MARVVAAANNLPLSPVVEGNHDEHRMLPVNAEKWKEMKELFSCPVCSHLYKGRINQCPNGHSYCQDCRATMISCPICREMCMRTRNYALEGVIALCAFKCKYYKQGCRKSVAIGEMEQHASTCGYRSMWCAAIGFDQCQEWTKFPDYLPHLFNHHQVKLIDNVYFKEGNYVSRSSAITNSREKFVDAIITFEGKQFILQFKVMDDHRKSIEDVAEGHLNKIICCWWISLFSPAEADCEDYTCQIYVRSTMEAKATSCVISWEGKVKPLRVKSTDVSKGGYLATTLANVLVIDNEATAEASKFSVSYEIGAVISKVPALVPELCDAIVPASPIKFVKETKEVQTDPVELTTDDCDRCRGLLNTSVREVMATATVSDVKTMIRESKVSKLTLELLNHLDVIIVFTLVLARILYSFIEL